MSSHRKLSILIALFLLVAACTPARTPPPRETAVGPVNQLPPTRPPRPSPTPPLPQRPAPTPIPQPSPTPAGPAVLLFTIGMHIEPMGTTAQGFQSGKADYNNPRVFQRHADDIDLLAQIVEAHGGVMVFQAQPP